MQGLTIGVTDCSKYAIYLNWAKDFAPEATFVMLGERENNINKAASCHGILLTGGEDVHPRFYNKPEYLELCYADDINEQRDAFELQLLRVTEEKGIPVLGICRGLQIANVFFGGTLVPDLPSRGKNGHSKNADGTDSYHMVRLTGSSLVDIHAHPDYEVNSNHHQAVDEVAEGLVITARAADDVPEAAERKASGKSYLQLVQWHPERMKDQHSVLSKGLLSSFIQASEKYLRENK